MYQQIATLSQEAISIMQQAFVGVVFDRQKAMDRYQSSIVNYS